MVYFRHLGEFLAILTFFAAIYFTLMLYCVASDACYASLTYLNQ